MTERLTWGQVWIIMAEAVACRSLCVRARVGAVIVTKDNRVQSASYNGPAPAFVHNGTPCSSWCPRAGKTDDFDVHYDDCVATHSEANAIARADWSQLEGATLYVSGATCFQCAKLIAQTGIARLVHRVDSTMGHRDPELVEDFLRRMGVVVERYDT
jgi:dCMP deaminase